jgi:DNA-binding IclR family transcriptional regulator
MSRTVERALAILDAFDTQHPTLSLQEISERVGMAKATTFRLVSTLQGSGFLMRLEDQRYSLSLKILRLAGLVRSNLGVREAVRPILADVCRKTGETVTLNLRSGIERICIDVVETPSPLMAIVRPGEHVSLLYGATARLLLAYAGDEEIDSIIERTPETGNLDIAALKADLAEIRAQGYACTAGQRIPGVTAISVPIVDMNREVHYSIAVTGPSSRMNPRLDEFKKIMIKAGIASSGLIGGTGTKPQIGTAQAIRKVRGPAKGSNVQEPTVKPARTRQPRVKASA